MSTTVRATSTATNTISTAVAISAPTGTAAGDVATVYVHCNSDLTITDNNGATSFTRDLLFDSAGGSGQAIAIFSRRIQSGDPATYNFTISAGGGRWSAIAITFQNPNATTIYNVSPTGAIDAVAGTSADAPTITTTASNAIHVAIVGPDGNNNAITGTPAGYTGIEADTNQALGAAYKVIAAAGATGAQTFTYTNSDAALGISFAIEDEGGAPVHVDFGPAIFRPRLRQF